MEEKTDRMHDSASVKVYSVTFCVNAFQPIWNIAIYVSGFRGFSSALWMSRMTPFISGRFQADERRATVGPLSRQSRTVRHWQARKRQGERGDREWENLSLEHEVQVLCLPGGFEVRRWSAAEASSLSFSPETARVLLHRSLQIPLADVLLALSGEFSVTFREQCSAF